MSWSHTPAMLRSGLEVSQRILPQKRDKTPSDDTLRVKGGRSVALKDWEENERSIQGRKVVSAVSLTL